MEDIIDETAVENNDIDIKKKPTTPTRIAPEVMEHSLLSQD